MTAWTAVTPDGSLRWEQGKPLSGDRAVVLTVTEALALPGQISVTVTGPAVERDAADPLAVLGVLFALYPGSVDLDGDVPDLTFGAPPDAVF